MTSVCALLLYKPPNHIVIDHLSMFSKIIERQDKKTTLHSFTVDLVQNGYQNRKLIVTL